MCERCDAEYFRRASEPIQRLITRQQRGIKRQQREIEALRHEIDSTIVLLSEYGYNVDMTKYGDTALYNTVKDLLDDRWRKDDQQ